MLPAAYMTERQMNIWNLIRQGYSQARIGRLINISRQAVFDVSRIALKKVDSALRHSAEANMIEVRHVDPRNGILLGFNPSTKRRVIVTFSVKHGIQTWHYENPECSECKLIDRCRCRLLEEAEERGISLNDAEKTLVPSRLAHVIFSRIIPGLEP